MKLEIVKHSSRWSSGFGDGLVELEVVKWGWR